MAAARGSFGRPFSDSDETLYGRIQVLSRELEQKGVWLSYATNHAAPMCADGGWDRYHSVSMLPGGLFPELDKIRHAADVIRTFARHRPDERMSRRTEPGRILTKKLQCLAEKVEVFSPPLPVYGEFLMSFLLLGYKISWRERESGKMLMEPLVRYQLIEEPWGGPHEDVQRRGKGILNGPVQVAIKIGLLRGVASFFCSFV